MATKLPLQFQDGGVSFDGFTGSFMLPVNHHNRMKSIFNSHGEPGVIEYIEQVFALEEETEQAHLKVLKSFFNNY